MVLLYGFGKKNPYTSVNNSKPSCVVLLVFFFFTAGILVFITAQLALQIKIHLCLLNCYLKWLPPTVTVGYYVVIYALSGNGSIAWIFKNKYMKSILIGFPLLTAELCSQGLVKACLIFHYVWSGTHWINGIKILCRRISGRLIIAEQLCTFNGHQLKYSADFYHAGGSMLNKLFGELFLRDPNWEKTPPHHHEQGYYRMTVSTLELLAEIFKGSHWSYAWEIVFSWPTTSIKAQSTEAGVNFAKLITVWESRSDFIWNIWGCNRQLSEANRLFYGS